MAKGRPQAAGPLITDAALAGLTIEYGGILHTTDSGLCPLSQSPLDKSLSHLILSHGSVEALGRVELPTNGLGNRCSIHLSYRAMAVARFSLLDRLLQLRGSRPTLVDY